MAQTLFSSIVWAQQELDLFNLPLETLLHLEVEATSKGADEIYRAPGVVSVITRKDIERYGAINLRDVVGRLPGVMLLTDGDIQNDNLGVRGEPVNLNNHLLMLLNGRPFRSVPGASDAFRRMLSAFPINMVERVEFIRGPGSVLYGSSAYTGVINVITRKAEADQASVTLGAGSHQARFGSLDVDKVSSEQDFSLSLNAQGWTDEGWTADFVDISDAQASRSLREDHRTVTVIAELGGFKASLFAGNRDSERFGQRLGFANVGELRDEHLYTLLGYSHAVNDVWQAEYNLSWLRLDVDEGVFKNDERLLEVDLRGQLSDQLELLIGANTLNTDFRSANPILDHYKVDTSQIYAQASYAFTPSTTGIVGAQANRTQNLNWDLVPRLGLIHQFDEEWGSKLLYSEAYRNPNAVETGVNIPTVIIGDPELDAETVSTVDWEVFLHKNTLFTSLSLFWSKQKHLVEAGPSTVAGYAAEQQNVSERRFYGAEWVASNYFSEQLKLDASLSYQRNQEKTGEVTTGDATTLPNVLAKLGLSYATDVFSMGLWDNYVSSFEQNGDFSSSKQFVNPSADSYHYVTANLRLSLGELLNQALLKGWEMKIFVQNLLDENIRQNSLETATPLNTFPAETDRSIYLSLDVAL